MSTCVPMPSHDPSGLLLAQQMHDTHPTVAPVELTVHRATIDFCYRGSADGVRDLVDRIVNELLSDSAVEGSVSFSTSEGGWNR